MRRKATVISILGILCHLSTLTEASKGLVTSKKTLRRSKRSSTPHDYFQATNDLDGRIDSVLHQIYDLIPIAKYSVSLDISKDNRDKAALGLANFLGMAFGMAAGAGGNTNFGELSTGQQVQVTAQFLYGYGYWGPFLLDFENPNLHCGLDDFEHVLSEYAFLTDMNHNYGYLTTYNGNNPREYLNDVNDPTILSYYATEFDHAIRRALYCILRKGGDTENALYLGTLIDLYIQLLNERLGMTEEAMQEMEKEIYGV